MSSELGENDLMYTMSPGFRVRTKSCNSGASSLLQPTPIRLAAINRHHELDLPAESLDAVLMSTVYHDTYWFSPNVDWGPVNQQVMLTELRNALKPGGVVAVLDHYAESGVDPRRSSVATHRIDPAVVRRDFSMAGFLLDGESDVLRSATDDYSVSVFDVAVRGRTDRFLMRFRRPHL